MHGHVHNAGFPRHSHNLTITSTRTGAGFGASANPVVIFVYNCSNLMVLDKTQATDWGINIALGAKWDSIAKMLAKHKFFLTMAKIGGKLAKGSPQEIDNIRNIMSYLFTAFDLATMKGPKIITIDVPFAGFGTEFSIHYLVGTVLVGKLQQDAKNYGG